MVQKQDIYAIEKTTAIQITSSSPPDSPYWQYYIQHLEEGGQGYDQEKEGAVDDSLPRILDTQTKQLPLNLLKTLYHKTMLVKQ